MAFVEAKKGRKNKGHDELPTRTISKNFQVKSLKIPATFASSLIPPKLENLKWPMQNVRLDSGFLEKIFSKYQVIFVLKLHLPSNHHVVTTSIKTISWVNMGKNYKKRSPAKGFLLFEVVFYNWLVLNPHLVAHLLVI